MASGEIYKLSLLLESKNVNPGVIGKFTSDLVRLRNEAKTTKSTYDSLFKTLTKSPSNSKIADSIKNISRESVRAVADVDRLQNKIERMHKSRSGGWNKNAASRELDGVFDERVWRDRRGRLRDERGRFVGGGGDGFGGGYDDDDYGGGRRRGVIGGLARLNESYLEPVRQTAQVWKSEFDSLSTYIEPAKRLARAKGQFQTIGLSDGDNARSFKAIEDLTSQIKGLSLADTTENFTDMFGALGNVDAAIRALPMAAKYQYSMSALHGDKYSREQISAQNQNLFKFLEAQGATQNPAQMQSLFDTVVKITNSTGGRVTSADLLQMSRRGGAAVQGLSADGLRNISAVIEELSGATTGTSLMSLYQSLVGNVQKQSATAEFQRLGLLNEGKYSQDKNGKIKLGIGANVLGRMMQEDPLKAADKLAEAMRGVGINTDNINAVNEELTILFGNRKAQQLMSMLINQREQVVKEANRAKSAKGGTELFAQVSNSELGKIREYEAALENFRTRAGLPLIQTLTKLTDAAMPLLTFFSNNSEVASWTMKMIMAGKVLSAFSQTASIFNGSATGSGLGLYFRRSAADADIATTAFSRTRSTAQKTVDVLTGVEKKASGVKGALGSLNGTFTSTFGMVLTGAIAGMTLEGVLSTINRIQEQQKTLEGKNNNLKTDLDQLQNNGGMYNAPGVGDKQKYNSVGGDLLDQIKLGRSLEYSLYPERAAWKLEDGFDFKHFWTADRPYDKDWRLGKLGEGLGGAKTEWKDGQLVKMSPYPTFDPEKAANKWRTEPQFSELRRATGDTNLLAGLIRQIKSDSTLNKDPDSLNLLLKGIESLAGKEQFQKANDAANKDAGGLNLANQGRVDFSKSLFPIDGLPTFNKPQTGLLGMWQPTPAQPKPHETKQTPPLLDQNGVTQLNQSINQLSNTFQNTEQKANPLPQTYQGFQQQLTNLNQPLGNTQQSFSGLSGVVDPLTGTFGSANNAVDSFANATSGAAARINSIQFQPPTFGGFTFGGSFGGGGKPTTGAPNVGGGKPFTIPGFNPPTVMKKSGGKKDGGFVRGGGLAYIHENELIVPADVTAKYREPETFAALRKREKPQSLITNIIHQNRSADGNKQKADFLSAPASVENRSEMDALSDLRDYKPSTRYDFNVSGSEQPKTNSSQSASITVNVPVTVPLTVNNTGGITGKDVLKMIVDSFPGELYKHADLIEYNIAKSFDRGRERN
ncbi:MAG: hypothetical protein M3209_00210 [Acidobacteriota bacterium]|nr:hypothetical protein [Acidobacteriota bacterium]